MRVRTPGLSPQPLLMRAGRPAVSDRPDAVPLLYHVLLSRSRPRHLAGIRLRGLAPTAIEQDGDGLYAGAGWRIGLTHDGGKSAHGLVRIGPAQRSDVRWYSLCWQRVYGVGTPSCRRRHQTRNRRGDNHANNIAQRTRSLLIPVYPPIPGCLKAGALRDAAHATLRWAAAVAEKERRLIGQRTREALGRAEGAGQEARRLAAEDRPEDAGCRRARRGAAPGARRPVLAELRELSANAIARELNTRQIATRRAASLGLR